VKRARSIAPKLLVKVYAQFPLLPRMPMLFSLFRCEQSSLRC
jgi:hypothetical protein